MMSTYARLGAESGYSMKVLEDHLVSLICDLFCRNSKAASLFGKPGVFTRPGNHHLETAVVADQTICNETAVVTDHHLETTVVTDQTVLFSCYRSNAIVAGVVTPMLLPVLLQIKRHCRKRLATCAARCRRYTYFVAGRVTGLDGCRKCHAEAQR
jgi:hypothetical protein